MKVFALLTCTVLLLTGCGTTVKAVPARNRQAVTVKKYRHRHRKPQKIVVVVGKRIKERPPRSVVIYYKDTPYLYADGVYYKSVDQDYEVIKPQIGMIVPELPREGVIKMKIKNEVHFVYDNVLYKEIPTSSGVQFEVQGFINESY